MQRCIWFDSSHRGHKQRPIYQIPPPLKFINKVSLEHNHVAALGLQQVSYEDVTSFTVYKAQSIYCHSLCTLCAVGVPGES